MMICILVGVYSRQPELVHCVSMLFYHCGKDLDFLSYSVKDGKSVTRFPFTVYAQNLDEVRDVNN